MLSSILFSSVQIFADTEKNPVNHDSINTKNPVNYDSINTKIYEVHHHHHTIACLEMGI